MKFKKWLYKEDGDLNSWQLTTEPQGHGTGKYVPPVLQNNNKKDRIDKLFGFVGETMRGASILFTDGSKTLVLKRGLDSPKSNKWDFPGGHSNKGETVLETAVRETKEECGVVAGTNVGKVSSGGWTIFVYKVDHPFACKLNKEHSDWKWINNNLLMEFDLLDEIKRDLPALIKLFPQRDAV
jgi:8-oxo-dGTP pyrophosphatase MutT (NUDIX family)